MALNRMDGASAVSATVAQGKAAASAGFGRASGALQADSPVIKRSSPLWAGGCYPPGVPCRSSRAMNSSEQWGRAVPPAEQDGQCAQAGAALL